jgi:lysophospholipase L1-like esterase
MSFYRTAIINFILMYSYSTRRGYNFLASSQIIVQDGSIDSSEVNAPAQLVFIGDSLIDWWRYDEESTRRETNENCPFNRAFPGATNLGIAGATIDSMVSYIAYGNILRDVPTEDVIIFVIEIGTNDAGQCYASLHHHDEELETETGRQRYSECHEQILDSMDQLIQLIQTLYPSVNTSPRQAPSLV